MGVSPVKVSFGGKIVLLVVLAPRDRAVEKTEDDDEDEYDQLIFSSLGCALRRHGELL